MASRRRLKIETGLAVVVPHLFIANVVMPSLAQRVPVLRLDNTDPTVVPSFTSLRVRPVGGDLTNPGLWVYLILVGVCFGVWAYLRRNALREWGNELLTESEINA